MRRAILGLAVVLAALATREVVAQEVSIESSKTMATVKGYAPRTLWLGVTAIVDGKERDFPAKKVKGKFSEFYTFDATSSGFMIGRGADVKWIACLWEKKVSKCGCIYCKRNGYHMEGRVARTED